MKPTFNKVGFFISLFKNLNETKKSTVSVDLFLITNLSDANSFRHSGVGKLQL
jgi:hypothetical protein